MTTTDGRRKIEWTKNKVMGAVTLAELRRLSKISRQSTEKLSKSKVVRNAGKVS